MEGITINCRHQYSSNIITIHYIKPGEFTRNRSLARTMTYIWATTGFFIPVGILAYCNYKLVASLIASSRLRTNTVHLRRNSSSKRETTIGTSLEPISIAKRESNVDTSLEPRCIDKREFTTNASLGQRSSGSRSSHSQGRSSHNSNLLRLRRMRSVQGRLSITFISIVVMYFLLVCPSELLYFYCDVGE